MTTKRKSVRIPTTKPSRIQITAHDSYRLEPAASRAHYGEHHTHSGGIPYAFRTKKAEDAWLVVSEWSARVLGVVEQCGDGVWSFSKMMSHVEAPRWVRPHMVGAVGSMIYNQDTHLHTGATAAEAIARGLRIPIATAPPDASAGSGKSTAQLNREIEQATGIKVQG